jgi:hypothetical protein
MSKCLRDFIVWTLVFAFSSSSVFAENRHLTLPDENAEETQGQSSVSEFIFKNSVDEPLIGVYLLGAVGKPGFYHVPLRTSLTSLLALSGGTLTEAELTDISIKRTPTATKQTGTAGIQQVNLEKILKSDQGPEPTLANNDIVMIPVKQPLFSNNTVVAVSIFASLMAIVVSGVLVSQEIHNH